MYCAFVDSIMYTYIHSEHAVQTSTTSPAAPRDTVFLVGSILQSDVQLSLEPSRCPSLSLSSFLNLPLHICCPGVLSMVGNGILLFVAYRKKSSLKPAEFFVVNLSISDLGMTITLFPMAIPSAF